MAGLADAVLVIEATPASGTLITARLATEYNRDVLAVPGSIFEAKSKGANSLISNGAGLVQDSTDILYSLNISQPAGADHEARFNNLSSTEKLICEALDRPLSRAELIQIIGSGRETVAALSIMEMKKMIGETDGKLHVLI